VRLLLVTVPTGHKRTYTHGNGVSSYRPIGPKKQLHSWFAFYMAHSTLRRLYWVLVGGGVLGETTGERVAQ
jgi:hypothetical protein